MRREQAKVPLDVSHLPERFGLFTILVLGESIAAVVAGLGGLGWELAPTLTAVLGVVVATGMWWMYFDNLEGTWSGAGPTRPKPGDPRSGSTVICRWPPGWPSRVSGWSTPCSRQARTTPTRHHAGSSSGPSPWPSRAMAAILIATVPRRGGRGHIMLARSRLIAIPFLLALGLLSSASSVVIVLLIAVICSAEVAADVILQTRSQSEVAADPS